MGGMESSGGLSQDREFLGVQLLEFQRTVLQEGLLAQLAQLELLAPGVPALGAGTAGAELLSHCSTRTRF